MGLTNLVKANAKTVLGADISTQSFAWCLWDDTGPVRWGEVKFEGKNVYERLADGQRKVAQLAPSIKADLVVVEGAVYVQNKKTVILLAYALGAIISSLYQGGMEIEEVSPMTWQNGLGNKALTKDEKKAIVDASPDKSKTWYNARFRELRKQRTMDIVKSLGVDADNDNVSDAAGIAYWAYNNRVAKP